MGICISSEYSERFQEEEEEEEDSLGHVTLYLEENIGFIGHQGTGSLYSKEGTKGLNQDSAILHQGYGGEDGALCGVFDGHGKNGHIVSKIVRNRLPLLLLNQKNALAKAKTVEVEGDGKNEKFEDDLVQKHNFYIWKEACMNAFKVMDKEVKLQENLDFSCSGTTAVVIIKQGEDLVIANLGDSRAVMGTTDENNNIMPVQLTIDLKPSVPSEAERIRKCNGRVLALREEPHIQRVWMPHEDSPGLAMTRSFGDFLLKNHGIIALPEIYYRRLTSNDQFIILASDGVWDVLSNKEVASIVWAADSEQAAAKAVVEAATIAWKKKFPCSKVDDCTALCLFLQKRQRHHSIF